MAYLLYFVVGGIVTTVIVALEESGYRTISGIAALVPVFTLVSYYFIGASKNGMAVSQHSQFVLCGTLVAWVPYMAVVALAAPRWGANKAILAGLLAFLILAFIFTVLVERYHWFQ